MTTAFALPRPHKNLTLPGPFVPLEPGSLCAAIRAQRCRIALLHTPDTENINQQFNVWKSFVFTEGV